MIPIKPIGKRAIIEMMQSPSLSSAIHIPDMAKKPPTEGVVLSLGQPCEDIKEGERVIIHEHGGRPVKIDGRDCKIVEYSEILGVLN